MNSKNNKLNIATDLHKSGNLLDAERCYLEILQDADDKNIRYLLGLLYSQIKQYTKAIDQLEKTLPEYNKNGSLFNALAICYQKIYKIKTAEKLINKACSLDPTNANYCNRKSKVLISSHKYKKSIDNSLLCISKHPNFFPAYQSYVTACNLLFRPDNSLRILKNAYKMFPDNPEYLFSLAEGYTNVGNHIKAKNILINLIKNNFKTAQCINNLGNIERDYGDIKIAIQLYQQAKQLSTKSSKEDSVIQWNLGIAQLLVNNGTESWNNYDSRLALNNKENEMIPIKPWQGESLNNKSIIILTEQGLGDEILFSSSYKWIIQQSEKTYIECDHRLRNVFSRSFPDATILGQKPSLMMQEYKYDFKIHAGSIFQYIINAPIPKEYLKPSPGKINKSSKISIGFSWKGATHYKDIKKRSTHLREWFPLLKNEQYNFYCLQHNITARERDLLTPFKKHITFLQYPSTHTDELVDHIAALDLVISVTNTNVHIAGALGIKTWCLTPHNPDWPWGLNNDHCKWYPAVKLIRQKNGNWKSTFSEIAYLLKNTY